MSRGDLYLLYVVRCQNSAVSITTRYGRTERGSNPGEVKRFSPLHNFPDRACGPPSLLFKHLDRGFNHPFSHYADLKNG